MGRAAKRAARRRPDRAAPAGAEPPEQPSPPQEQPSPPPQPPAASGDVPGWLRVGAAWSWRLVLLAALLYVAGRVASTLYLVIVPFAAALLLTALLQPLAAPAAAARPRTAGRDLVHAAARLHPHRRARSGW